MESILFDYASTTAPRILRRTEPSARAFGEDLLSDAEPEHAAWATLSAKFGRLQSAGPDALHAEDVVHGLRAAWTRVERPPGSTEEQWTTVYIRVLGRCLEAYFASASSGNDTAAVERPGP